VAEWNDLLSFVRVRYEITRQRDGELLFRLPTPGDRTQTVAVRRVTGDDGHPWAQITSAVGRVEELDLARALELAAGPVTGGVVAVDGLVLFRHAVPLVETALDGFDRSFRLVVDVADRLEHELTGGDEH
jgi:hypothetical protein